MSDVLPADLFNPFDDPREYREFLLADLVIDSVAQRPVDDERVHKIAHDFDWLRFETPTVVLLPDGRARVLEGQHRIQALRLIADDTTVVMCAVLLIPADRSAEATLAYCILRGRRGHSAFERWGLLVTMCDPHTLAAEAELSARHLRVGRAPDPFTVAAVHTLGHIVHGARRTPAIGAALLGRTLDVVGAAFAADEQATGSRWDGRLLRAVAELLVRHPDIDDEHLTRVLGSHESIQWIQRATRLAEEPIWRTIADMVWSKYSRAV